MTYLGGLGHLYPWDVRFDPGDAAHCTSNPDGEARFRLVTEAAFREAHLVRHDGTGFAMDRVAAAGRTVVWEVRVPGTEPFRYTFALATGDGRRVYRVPAGIANAVERLDRWEFDPGAARRLDVPDWARGAVVYQIFPERFADGDPSLTPEPAAVWGAAPRWLEFQGGDLIGIAERADHIAALGVDVVYVNPIFTSPSTHKYDCVDYYSVDPAFGGGEALAAVVDALHSRGIRLVLDASFNHCHPRFFAFSDVVARGEESPYRSWFVVHDPPPRITVRPGAVASAGWRADPGAYLRYVRDVAERSGMPIVEVEGDGPPVELSYEAWYGVPSMPRIDLSDPGARSYFLDVARYWVEEFHVDGWRMDVARYIDADFWPEFRAAVREIRPDAYLIAEVMGDASQWLQGDAFDATMNYTFRALVLDFLADERTGGDELAEGLVRMYARYAPEVAEACQNLIGSHDTARFLHEAGGRGAALRLATVLQMTLPGAPGLYYGDEVGMTGGEEPGSRGAFPWHDEAAWDRDQLDLVRILGRLRREHPSLRRGSLAIVWYDRDGIGFVRSGDGERILVVVNRGEGRRIELPVGAARVDVLMGDGAVRPGRGSVVAHLAEGSAVVAALT